VKDDHKNILCTYSYFIVFFNEYKLMFTQVILSICHCVLLLSYLNEASFRKYSEKAIYTF
jgi:hypothetical protein